MTKAELQVTSAFKPARRTGVSCIVGIAGETGAGKSLTGLRVARGLAADPGEDLQDPATLAKIDARIAAIDTEAGRLLHYAVAEGELPRPFSPKRGAAFGFQHADLKAPFSPERYQELIEQADAAGFRVIMVDSFSHEWDGEGGCSDIHDDDLEAMLTQSRKRVADRSGNLPSWWDESQQRDKLSLTAWKGAKMRHKRMVGRLLQCRAHIVVCMRAEDKMRIETRKEQGNNGKEYTKTVITAPADMPPALRWQPICEKRFPFQLITSIVLAPDQPGVPIPLKMQEQHRGFMTSGEPLDERFGVALAAWARGAEPESSRPAKPSGGFGGDVSDPIDNSFPGDAPPPAGDPYSDMDEDKQLHDEHRIYGGAVYEPDDPREITPAEPIMQAEQKPLKAWAATLRDMLQHAPDDAARRAWLKENAASVARLKTRSEALHGWALAFQPAPDPE